MAKTYQTLLPLVIEEIEKRRGTIITSINSRFSVQPGGAGGSLDSRSLSEMVSTIASDLTEIIGVKIISGLDVTATSPPSTSIEITAGTATSHGKLWTLTEDITIKIPLDSSTQLFFVTIYDDTIDISRTYDDTRCELCKVVVSEPGVTAAIVDDKPKDGYDAYIISAKDIVYKEDQEFDDASVEKLRDVIGDVLADNLVGNIRLSENLKITNTQGTLELDSASVKIKSFEQNTLAEFNKNGTFFYDQNGVTLAKFGTTEAYIGNILLTKNSIQTRNFSAGLSGFQILDSGDVEFNNGTFRGTLSANIGNIGGWTLAASEMYATTTGTIKTSLNAGSGYNGVVLDKNGLRVYDDILGEVVNLPSDGSAPSFASGIIQNTIFEINTNAVMRTSETVGDGSADSMGILINNTGIYGCEANQLLKDANFKIKDDGSAYFKGEIQATSGNIGGIAISENQLIGGTLIGTLIRSAEIETSSAYPKILVNSTGMSYQITQNVGQYGDIKYGTNVSSGAGIYYGAGVTAFLFNEEFPVLAVMTERTGADIRLYNRAADPITDTHAVGDLICTSANLKICDTAGSPGTFTALAKVGAVAPVDATYICKTANTILTAEQALSSLTTGIMYVTTTTGAITSLGNPLPIANGGTASATRNFVDLSSGETVAGIKTFSSFPITPSSAPTTDYQTANKKYVDDNKTTTVFGTWVNKSADYANQQATTDGLVIVTTINSAVAYVATDSTNPASTARGWVDTSLRNSCCVPVKKDDWWLVSLTSGTIVVWWISVGS